MFTEIEKKRIEENYFIAIERIKKHHIGCFKGHRKPVFLISETYPGVWLEHLYDSVILAKMFPEYIEIAQNTIELFLDNQKANGQLPCYVWDGNKVDCEPDRLIGYGQVQECVSFAQLAFEVCQMLNDRNFTLRCYESAKKWESWFCEYRMTQNKGLVEMFVGHDCGHDNSGRKSGMMYRGNRGVDGVEFLDASLPPKEGDIAPIFAVDMNCNFYATRRALAEFAKTLGLNDENQKWEAKALEIKENLFAVCYNENDEFFYDVDKYGKERKYLSSTIFHLFLEKVLDKEKDKELIECIYRRHIKNPNEFWTEYPFPSMAICDASCENHAEKNCWGYYSQALIALRCTRWMEYYEMEDEYKIILEKWVRQWTFDNKVMFGQEIDPITGVATDCSEWYSSCMLLYIYAVKYLKI